MKQRPDTTDASVANSLSRLFEARAGHWALLSQAAASVTNFLPAVLLARVVSTEEFSAFAIVSTSALFVMSFARSLLGEPLLVAGEADARRVGAGVVEIATAGGFVLGMAMALVSIVVGPTTPLGQALVVGGVMIPVMTAQDMSRYVMFSRSEYRMACINDVTWLGLLSGVFAVLAALHLVTVESGILAWGGTGLAAACVARIQLGDGRLVFSTLGLRTLFREGKHLALQFVVVSGATQFGLYALGAASSLEDVGIIRGAQLLFGPLQIIFVGASVVLLPRARKSPPQRFLRLMVLASLTLSGLVLVELVVLLAMPNEMGRLILGETWDGTADLVLPYALYMLMLTLGTGGMVGLQALGEVRWLSVIRLVAAPFLLLVPVLLAVDNGAVGFSWAMVFIAALMSVAAWLIFLERVNKSPTSPVRMVS